MTLTTTVISWTMGDNPMPYRLLIEIDQPSDDQPSLVYSVEVANADP